MRTQITRTRAIWLPSFTAAFLLISSGLFASPLVDEQQSQVKVLRKLNEFIEMGEHADGNVFGFLIRDANRVSLDEKTMAVLRPLRDQAVFKRSLIEALDRHSSSIGAYVALNQLYPQHALKLFGDGFYLNGPQTPKFLPLSIRTKAGTSVQRTPRRVMSDIAREYWTDILLTPAPTNPQKLK